MQWVGITAAIPPTLARVMIRAATERSSPRLRYGLPILLVPALTGLVLALAPVSPARGLFQLLIIAVLVMALSFGIRSAFITVALGTAAGYVAGEPTGLPWAASSVHLTELILYTAEAGIVAVIGALLRTTIRTARTSPAGHAELPRRGSGSASPVGPLGIEHLTPRETEVLRLAASGRSVEELARELYVSPNTVKTHLAHCYDKLGAHSRAEAIALAVHSGLFDATDLDRAAELALATGAGGSLVVQSRGVVDRICRPRH